MARLMDNVENQNCSGCFFAMEVPQEGLHVVGKEQPAVYFCMRNPPQVSMVPMQAQVQGVQGGGVQFQPLSQFPAVRKEHVCGEYVDATEVEEA